MEFNSVEYIIFLAAVFIIYQFINQRLRLILLLVASYVFYGCWNVKYSFLIVGITLASYISGYGMQRFPNWKKKIVALSILSLVFVLFIFKYFNFFGDFINYLLTIRKIDIRISNLNILLPIGISFYIFQAISYIMDVYREKYAAEKSLLKYALYIAFFPQLVAGPIERADNIIPQLEKTYKFDYEQTTDGMILITWGLFKKMVIADELAVYVDMVYGNVVAYTGFSLVTATVMFAIQIYCDFSGYSDIAIGSAKMFGINLMKNFHAPYLSCSLQEFWTRWHISLSQWLRDYIYIPLGGGYKGKVRANINLLITFLLSGLWHGANVTYLLWGGVFGLAGVVEKNIHIKRDGKLSKIIGIVVTFCISCFAWIFFRSNTLEEAKYIIYHLTENITQWRQYLSVGYQAIGWDTYKRIQIMISVLILFLADIVQDKGIGLKWVRKLPVVIRWGIYILLVLCVLLFSRKGGVEFVYFQF